MIGFIQRYGLFKKEKVFLHNLIEVRRSIRVRRNVTKQLYDLENCSIFVTLLKCLGNPKHLVKHVYDQQKEWILVGSVAYIIV